MFIDRSAAAIARLQQSGLADPELDPEITARAERDGQPARVRDLRPGRIPAFDTLVDTVTRLWTNALRMPRD